MGAGLTSTVATTVAIVGGVQIGLPSGATQIVRHSNANNSTADLYTVTAGKTLYITSVFATCYSNATTVGLTLVQFDEAGTQRTLVTAGHGGVGTMTGMGNNAIPFIVPIQVAATKKVQVVASGAVASYAGFAGYEL